MPWLGVIVTAPAARSKTIILSSQDKEHLMGLSPDASFAVLPLRPTFWNWLVCGSAAASSARCSQLDTRGVTPEYSTEYVDYLDYIATG